MQRNTVTQGKDPGQPFKGGLEKKSRLKSRKKSTVQRFDELDKKKGTWEPTVTKSTLKSTIERLFPPIVHLDETHVDKVDTKTLKKILNPPRKPRRKRVHHLAIFIICSKCGSPIVHTDKAGIWNCNCVHTSVDIRCMNKPTAILLLKQRPGKSIKDHKAFPRVPIKIITEKKKR